MDGEVEDNAELEKLRCKVRRVFEDNDHPYVAIPAFLGLAAKTHSKAGAELIADSIRNSANGHYGFDEGPIQFKRGRCGPESTVDWLILWASYTDHPHMPEEISIYIRGKLFGEYIPTICQDAMRDVLVGPHPDDTDDDYELSLEACKEEALEELYHECDLYAKQNPGVLRLTTVKKVITEYEDGITKLYADLKAKYVGTAEVTMPNPLATAHEQDLGSLAREAPAVKCAPVSAAPAKPTPIPAAAKPQLAR